MIWYRCEYCGNKVTGKHECVPAKQWDSQGRPLAGKTEIMFDDALKALEQGSTVYLRLPNER